MANRVSSTLETFLRWWLDELKALTPRSPAAFRGRAPRRLVISLEGRKKRLLLEKGSQLEVLGETQNGGGAALIELTTIAKTKGSLPVGLRFLSQDCFSRTVDLPARAEANFSRMLDLDMERSTPFRSADVLTAYYALPAVGATRGKRALRQLIVKRKNVETLIEELRTLGIEPAFIDCWDEERQSGVPADFLASRRPDVKRRGPGITPVMAALALALAISAAGIVIMRHQNALDALKARAEAARVEAAKVRLAVDASEAASARITAMQRLVRVRLPVARIIEELTAIMPDSAWVSDLRISDDTVEFTGFAKSAASLIPLLAKSPLFTEASLTSPVILDTVEDKERFSVRLRLKDRTAFAKSAEAISQAEARP